MSKTHLITTIDFLRHGECHGGEIFRGSTDVELTEAGWNSMLQVIESRKQAGLWEHIVTSPLRRCQCFAEQLHAEHAIPLSIEGDFREMDFGDWEGQDVNKIRRQETEKVNSLYHAPAEFQAPNGETMSAFGKRLFHCSHRVIQQHRGKHLLFIQHGGTIRMLLTQLLSMPVSAMACFKVPYTCFSRVSIHHDGDTDTAYLEFHNV